MSALLQPMDFPQHHLLGELQQGHLTYATKHHDNSLTQTILVHWQGVEAQLQPFSWQGSSRKVTCIWGQEPLVCEVQLRIPNRNC